jgi:hypothetical protein
MEEPSADGDPKDMWPYHHGCWYALLSERGAKWILPLSVDANTPEVMRIRKQVESRLRIV